MDTDKIQSTQSDAPSSFNAWGVVTLSGGQRVNVQTTGRHGISIKEMYEDFCNYVAFLDLCATDHAVEFWAGKSDGKGSDSPAKTEKTEGTETSVEPERERIDDSGNPILSFPAGQLTVEFKNQKPYFAVEDASGKKTKYPVRVWPEVLEKIGIIETDVDPKVGKSMVGWTAVYTKNEKGYPGKVIALEKPDFA